MTGLRSAVPRIDSESARHDHAKEEKQMINGYIAEAYQPAPTTTLKSSENPYPFIVDYLPQSMRPVLKSILSSSESRPIFYFLLLNLVYLFVQLIWGAWTNSLGLISDAVHMAFDCAALGVGLAASVMARWEKGGRWTYG
jgi:zinc transporter 5/7